MHHQIHLAPTPFAQKRRLVELIANGDITLGGYVKNKIYGTLNCGSGKRMKATNRIFFKDEREAQKAGFRPCAHCLPERYAEWKRLTNIKTNHEHH